MGKYNLKNLLTQKTSHKGRRERKQCRYWINIKPEYVVYHSDMLKHCKDRKKSLPFYETSRHNPLHTCSQDKQ